MHSDCLLGVNEGILSAEVSQLFLKTFAAKSDKPELVCICVCVWFLLWCCMLGMLTTSLLRVRPFDDQLKAQTVTREVEEFVPEEGGQFAFPFTTYINHLFVHPRSLKYDGQKAFAKVCYFPYFKHIGPDSQAPEVGHHGFNYMLCF